MDYSSIVCFDNFNDAKMILTPIKELVLKLICLFIIIGLCLAIYYNGKNLDCNKCEITFKSKDRITGYVSEVNVSVQDLYLGFHKDICVIEGDGSGGFIFNEFK